MFKSKKNQPDFKFDLGDEVKDKITGYSGIVVYRSQWIHNCNVYGVRSRELKDGRPVDSVQFDEPQLDLIKPEVIKKKRDTGGPCKQLKPTNRI